MTLRFPSTFGGEVLRAIVPFNLRGVCIAAIALAATALGSSSACAAADAAIDVAKLSLFWVLPFAGILGSLALFPMVAPQFWHRNYGFVSLFWGLAFLGPFAAFFGTGAALHELVHVLLLEYIPFIALIGALFTIAGGIYVGGGIRGTPALNATIMLAGMVLGQFRRHDGRGHDPDPPHDPRE